MRYLIFRNDRIGDFFITAPLIKSIKRNDLSAHISVVCSEKNIDFVKEIDFVDNVYIFKDRTLKSRIDLLNKLRKTKFDTIIIADKKNRSLLYGFLIKSKNKIFNVSKKFHHFFLKFFFKNVFLINDDNNLTNEQNINENLEALNFKFINEDYTFLHKESFNNVVSFKECFEKNNKNIILHLDEKWDVESYAQIFQKAQYLTNIQIDKEGLISFCDKVLTGTNKTVFITTGMTNNRLIETLKNDAKKINDKTYQFNFANKKIFLVYKADIFSMINLISNCHLMISCHGAFTHVGANFKLEVFDIIEKRKENHYKKITSHMKKYKSFYRDKFDILSVKLVNSL